MFACGTSTDCGAVCVCSAVCSGCALGPGSTDPLSSGPVAGPRPPVPVPTFHTLRAPRPPLDAPPRAPATCRCRRSTSTCARVHMCGQVIEPGQFGNFEEFYGRLQAEWDKLWADVYAADVAGECTAITAAAQSEGGRGERGAWLHGDGGGEGVLAWVAAKLKMREPPQYVFGCSRAGVARYAAGGPAAAQRLGASCLALGRSPCAELHTLTPLLDPHLCCAACSCWPHHALCVLRTALPFPALSPGASGQGRQPGVHHRL